VSAEEFRDEVKHRAAVALFREGRVSSGLAARWLKMPRVKFLLLAMQEGGELLAALGTTRPTSDEPPLTRLPPGFPT